jgi:hypothetical protein
MGANGIQRANQIIIKKTFLYEWILEQCFLQFVVINAYSCPST